MSRKTRPLGWRLVSMVFAFAIACASRAGEPEQGKGPAAKPPATQTPGGIIISREITFITGPLRSDGSVDYLASLNERSSQGVTLENNAAIPLLQALGPAVIRDSISEQFFKMLGIAPLPKDGPYFQSFEQYGGGDNPALKVREVIENDLERCMNRPWSKADVPVAALWLEEYQKQIELIVAATKRPRFYSPRLAEKDEPGTARHAFLSVRAAIPRGRPGSVHPGDVPPRRRQARGGVARPSGLSSPRPARRPGANGPGRVARRGH